MRSRNNPKTNTTRQNVVYMDYAATTPVDPEVVAVMTQHLGLDGVFGNAASHTHVFGREAEDAVEIARAQVAELLYVNPSEIVWTSGATESVNLAIKGVAQASNGKGKHIVTSSMEHKAVLDTCHHLANEGFEITCLDPDANGLITADSISRVLRDDTILVSLMHVNNEVGTITDVNEISEITRSKGVIFHIDAAQSLARLPLDMKLCQADLVSISGHKIYGPKGVGALFVRRHPDLPLKPQIHGGDQEKGMRSGTIATHQVVGMGKAAQLVRERREYDSENVQYLESRLLNKIEEIEHAFINGNQTHRVSGIVNICFTCVSNESLMMSLKDVAISSGSACTSSRIEPSHVLLALGMTEELANCSVRFSLGRYSTKDEVDFVSLSIRKTVDMLRHLSTEWKNLQYHC